MPESKEMWLTPRANEPENDTGFVERNGDRGAHCFGSLADQVRGTLPLGHTQLPRKFVKPKTAK